MTRYELQLAPGIKVSRVTQLRDDLAYALATTEIRILAPIPGKQAVGVEVSEHLAQHGHPRRHPRGADGRFQPADGVARQGHLRGRRGLRPGQDAAPADRRHHGSGKSGCINAVLCSILLRATPDEVRMILVDPKRVELNHYESIPHLLTPVVTNMKNAALVLQNIVREMESRYELMGAVKARNLAEWNRKRLQLGQDTVPHILVVIDELADLMMVSPADVEDAIIRLAQKSRAVGIHLVLATQSPRVDVITGMIKANVPSRIAFAVSSQTDSRVILDVNGAEALLGAGDMLYKPLGTSKMQRVQGAYISEDETRRIVEACRKQGEPTFEEELLELPADVEPEQLDADEDPVLNDAIRLVAQHQTASVSLLQRRLRVGYTRAGRLIDMLERRGIVSGYEGSKARNVLISETDLARILGEDRAPADRRAGRGLHLLDHRRGWRWLVSSRDRRLVCAAPGQRTAGHAGTVCTGAGRRLPAGHGAAAARGSRSSVAPPTCRPSHGRWSARTAARGSRCYPGTLTLEDAVFAEFELDGLPLEVAAQRDHVHRRLGAATIGISRVLEMEGDVSRDRLAARVAGGEDWLEAAMHQTGLTRSALEALATANAAVARRVLGVRTPGPSLRDYLIPLLVGFLSEFLIILATASGHSQDFTGLMLMVQAIVLGAVFGARMGLIAALTPLRRVRRRDRIQLPGRQRELRQRRLQLPVCELHLRCAAGRKRGRRHRPVARSLLPARHKS